MGVKEHQKYASPLGFVHEVRVVVIPGASFGLDQAPEGYTLYISISRNLQKIQKVRPVSQISEQFHHRLQGGWTCHSALIQKIHLGPNRTGPIPEASRNGGEGSWCALCGSTKCQVSFFNTYIYIYTIIYTIMYTIIYCRIYMSEVSKFTESKHFTPMRRCIATIPPVQSRSHQA